MQFFNKVATHKATKNRKFFYRNPALAYSMIAMTLTLCIFPITVTAQSISYNELYRPQFHYSPTQNWMNDPNGLLYYNGEYNLFYQYNPLGNNWGNMSWGHAVSHDLIHWTNMPVAIPQGANNMIFSGCAIVDTHNTTGFGKPGHPAIVAIYTSDNKVTGVQSQSLSFSTNGGLTFQKYKSNPVLNIGSNNFRDPNVFWYKPSHEWVMAVALSDQQKISFYSSPNLKHWTHLSDFGPDGATGGVWEAPDLFPMPDPNHPSKQKWVLIVNLNPGGIAGGSGVQYFIGNFNGKTFTSKPYITPTGESLGNFDNGTFDGWKVTGSAFGNAPATSTLPGEMTVSGWNGTGFVDSFHGGDGSLGNMTSPNFILNKNYINFLIGGGDNPYVPGSVPVGTIPSGITFANFEGRTYGKKWKTTGDFIGTGPIRGTFSNQQTVHGYLGNQLVNTFFNGDGSTGTITSPSFTISKHYINLLIGGGNNPWGSPHPTCVNLIVDGKVIKTATGKNIEFLNWVNWDVKAYQGKTAKIQIVDESSQGWGHINVDQIMFSDKPAPLWAQDTSVKLIVDGKVVRSSTGQNSETLDWTNWNIHDLIGKKAHIEISDNSTNAWGHILTDDLTMANAPALSTVQTAHWLDYGADDYAASTYNNVPNGKRILIGWMNNWNYAGFIPTSPWRGAMTIPKELTLSNVNGKLELLQKPIQQLNGLLGSTVHLQNIKINSSTTALPFTGRAYEINTTFELGSAKNFGLNLRTGSGQKTVVGYDKATGEVYIDRTHSGDVNFSTSFPGVQRAPLAINPNKSLTLKVLVDWSSIEVFSGNGSIVLTDQIFPNPSSNGMSAFAIGGTVTLHSFKVTKILSA